MSTSQLYERHADDVARWVAYLCVGIGPERDDLVHDVFTVAIRRWPAFRGEARPTTWLYRITRNVVRNHLRRQRFRRWFHLDDDDNIPSLAPSAELALIAEHQREQVRHALDQLSPRNRELLVLAEWENMSGQQIADCLDMRVGAVWVALHRARQAFAKKLAELDGGAP